MKRRVPHDPSDHDRSEDDLPLWQQETEDVVAKRTDGNQAEIYSALRSIGATVQDLSAVGKGCPDALVGFQGRNTLLEIKRPDGPRGGRSGRSLTTDQVSWHGEWRGQVATVRNVDEAIQAVLGRAR